MECSVIMEAISGSAVGEGAEKERSINPGGSSVVTVDASSNVERRHNVVGIMKAAGVTGGQQQQRHGRADDSEASGGDWHGRQLWRAVLTNASPSKHLLLPSKLYVQLQVCAYNTSQLLLC